MKLLIYASSYVMTRYAFFFIRSYFYSRLKNWLRISQCVKRFRFKKYIKQEKRQNIDCLQEKF